MKKTIEELSVKEKFDLVEYCAYKLSQLKDLMLLAKTEMDKTVLHNYSEHLKNIILKVKETLYEQNKKRSN